jgi:nucleoid-associated protein YgaU
MDLYSTADIYTFPDGSELVERIPKTQISRILTNHILLGGETLQDLSDRYYGKTNNWQNIADANLILNPYDIEVGTNLIIPVV